MGIHVELAGSASGLRGCFYRRFAHCTQIQMMNLENCAFCLLMEDSHSSAAQDRADGAVLGRKMTDDDVTAAAEDLTTFLALGEAWKGAVSEPLLA